jgi:hypothetical protein
MKEWFYVKNDLKTGEDIKDFIMRPIWQRFGLRKPKVEIDEAAEECQRAFGVVCSFIRTRDLIQEHIVFRVWPLAEKWEVCNALNLGVDFFLLFPHQIQALPFPFPFPPR